MANWTTISSLATAAGTLTLAMATFASVRSANRAARVAERAFQVSLRPVLMPSRPQDPSEIVMWLEGRWSEVKGGRAVVEEADENVYLVMSLRNAGSGIAVLQAWHASGEHEPPDAPPPDLDTYRRQQRDLYVPAGDVGFWQGRVRSGDDPAYEKVHAAVSARDRLTLYLLYSDHEGGQRTVSRFMLVADDDPDSDSDWLTTGSRHWHLDGDSPRDG